MTNRSYANRKNFFIFILFLVEGATQDHKFTVEDILESDKNFKFEAMNLLYISDFSHDNILG